VELLLLQLRPSEDKIARLLFADLRLILVLFFNSEILAGNTFVYLLFCTFNWRERVI